MSMTGVRAVLFDLDGTLIDTAADLLGALDDLRAELNLAPIASQLPPAVAARGGRGMLRLSFPGDEERVESLLPRYLAVYAQRLARCSRPYDGISELLDLLTDRGVSIAVVTNKPIALATQLLLELGWGQRFGSVVGGDSLPVRKPAPDPIWRACTELSVPAQACAMVGDDRRDIEAGRAAGCALTIAAAYGYLEADDRADQWSADHLAASVHDLKALLNSAVCGGRHVSRW